MSLSYIGVLPSVVVKLCYQIIVYLYIVYCCTPSVIITIIIIVVIIVIISLLFDYRGHFLEDSAKLEHENVVVNEARQ